MLQPERLSLMLVHGDSENALPDGSAGALRLRRARRVVDDVLYGHAAAAARDPLL